MLAAFPFHTISSLRSSQWSVPSFFNLTTTLWNRVGWEILTSPRPHIAFLIAGQELEEPWSPFDTFLGEAGIRESPEQTSISSGLHVVKVIGVPCLSQASTLNKAVQSAHAQKGAWSCQQGLRRGHQRFHLATSNDVIIGCPGHQWWH